MGSFVDLNYGVFSEQDVYQQPVTQGAFGVEYLGWGRLDFEWLQGLDLPTGQAQSLIEEYNITHLRWPGGIPAEEPFSGNSAGSGLDDYTLGDLRLEGYHEGATTDSTVPVFDLADPNFVNWYYFTHSLDRADYGAEQERPGLNEIIAASESIGIESLSIVVPTARYAARMFDENDSGNLGSGDLISEVVAQAASDMSFFLENLQDSLTEQGADMDVTLEIGSEYYATGLWKHFLKNGHDFDISDEELQSNLLSAFGLVFATHTAVISDFEAQTGLDINVAVQLGRTQANNIGPDGSASDQDFFIEAFSLLENYWNEAAEIVPYYSQNELGGELLDGLLANVDMGIWHRYVSEWETLDDHLTQDQSPDDENTSGRLTVSEMLENWEQAGAGGAEGELGLLAGWSSPVAGSHDYIDSRVCPSMTLELFSQLMSAGMEQSSIYGWNSNKVGALTNANSETIGGQIFGMMSVHLPDTFLLGGFEANTKLAPDASDEMADLDGDGWYEPSGDLNQVNEYHFANSYKIVSYFTAGTLSGIDGLAFEASYGGTSFAHIELTSLYLDTAQADNHAVYATLPNGSVSDTLLGHSGTIEELDFTLVDNADGTSNVNFEFSHDFETVQLVGYFDTVYAINDFDLASIGEEATAHVFDVDLSLAPNLEAISVWGNDERNLLTGHGGANSLFGGEGKDTLVGGSGDDLLDPGAGDTADYYRSDILSGGQGNDTYWIDATERDVNVRIIESEEEGDDVLHINGVTAAEIVAQVYTKQEVDWLQLEWAGGVVRLNDLGQNLEKIVFDDGTEIDGLHLLEVPGEPTQFSSENDFIVGSAEHDQIKAGNGSDILIAGDGDDTLAGGAGNDHISGGNGDDRIWGHGGADVISAGDGANTVFAGRGDDIIIETGADSILSGDLGADTYVIRDGFGGTDRILGFEVGEDLIDLTFFDGLEYEDLIIDANEDGTKFKIEISGTTDADDILVCLDAASSFDEVTEECFLF